MCERCAAGFDAIALSGGAVGALKRLRALRWDVALRLSLARTLEAELCAVIEALMARLAGQRPRSARFLAQIRQSLGRVAEPGPDRRSR